MQPPTLCGVRLRTVQDALKIFHAVSLGYLPRITRRLDFEERREIKSGNVYVWEERNPASNTIGLGIERWTDGRQYTPSRVRDEFLLYVVKDPDPFPTGSMSTDPAQAEAHRLIKQTYSVYVAHPQPRRKWHITAYYTPATLRNLGTVDDVPDLLDIRIPDGAYIPARHAKHTKNSSRGRRNSVSSDVSENSQHSPTTGHSNYQPTPLYIPHVPFPRQPHPYDSPHPSGSLSAPAHMPPPTSFHPSSRSYSMPQRPRSTRPVAFSHPNTSPPSNTPIDTEYSGTISTYPVIMVPLNQLQQGPSHYYRNPIDDNILRSFQSPPPSR